MQVQNRASEKGLSLLTRGRLLEAVMPSFSIVTLIVAPFKGLPPLECWGRRVEPVAAGCSPWPARPAGSGRPPGLHFRAHEPPSRRSCGDRYPPSRGLQTNHCQAADQIEVEEHACHWPGHPGDVPGPVARQRMFTCARVRPRRAHWPDNWWAVYVGPGAWPGPGDAADHPRVRHAVKAGLRCQIPPLIGQSLARSGLVAGC